MAIIITQYFIKTPAKLHGDHKTQEALIFRYVGYSSERSAFEWEKNCLTLQLENMGRVLLVVQLTVLTDIPPAQNC